LASRVTTQLEDGWSAGDAYEDFMGRWSRPLARSFVRWLEAPLGGHWLDVGTGTGALTAAICEEAQPSTVIGCDPSANFIDVARSRLPDSRVTWCVAGVGELPAREDGYDAVASGLALNFFPDAATAVKEQLDLTRRDGLVAAVVWDYAAGMEFLRRFWDAAIRVEPAAEELDEGRRFPICRPDALEALFRHCGAREVRVEPLSVPTVFTDFDDYWRPFFGGTGPGPSLVAALSDQQRARLEQDLRTQLAARPHAPIRLSARAWAVCGLA
jgi:SAM-dependent methyltransferase